ncbi:hypothetical protein [Corallococcus macrosporus]|uniref:Uncharacterized protein n=1 Tax=Corallococcus macrosporus DSM 14697 TaxID=1189310 RepID=A0A250JNJ1_9BACT|nr:hypothetical protein [Corallococcus macrosporus]ATB44686.1 hypothetical protein MYMAC_000257 [Corallococcus macrosporus DSM 14697]
MTTPDKNLQLSISLPEANLILEALGQLPYVRVFQLVDKLQRQAQPQITGTPEAPHNVQSLERRSPLPASGT